MVWKLGNHLWLNEGFARFIQCLCIDHFFPEYKVRTDFVSGSFSRAMTLDALHSSNPIEIPVSDDDDSSIVSPFDRITYDKGAAVIRMSFE